MKCFPKFGKATPWDLIQAIDSLFEQNPDLRAPCEILVEIGKNDCDHISDCQERQRCYYQLERKRASYVYPSRKDYKYTSIATKHRFRLSSNSDTIISFGTYNSIFYKNKYADCCLTGCYLLKEKVNQTDMSRKKRKFIARRFEEEIIRRLEQILIEMKEKQQ